MAPSGALSGGSIGATHTRPLMATGWLCRTDSGARHKRNACGGRNEKALHEAYFSNCPRVIQETPFRS